MTNEDGEPEFLFTYPMYSYLIEPGPRPGFLRDPKSQVVFVPLWTDDDTFESYLQSSGLADKVSALVIFNRAELVEFLRRVPANVAKIIVDPMKRDPKHVARVLRVDEMRKSLQ